MRALLIICLFLFVEFCMGKGRTFCGDGQRLAFTFAPLAASRACGCKEKGRGEGLPAAPHSVGKRRAVRWAMQRAAMAGGACCAGLYSVLPSGVRKTPFPHWACLQPSLDVLATLPWRACSPVSMCLQPSLGVLAALPWCAVRQLVSPVGNLPWKACGRGASFYLKPSSVPPFFLQR